jgi:hypothetical protein
MSDVQARAFAIAVDALRRIEAELAGQPIDPVVDLRRRCRELGIPIDGNLVNEKVAGRLVGLSPVWPRNYLADELERVNSRSKVL